MHWVILSYIMYYMKTVSTRELQHEIRAIRLQLEKGKSFAWTQRGKVIAHIHPVSMESENAEDWPDILERIRRSGATIPSGKSISDDLYAERER